jgi:hypothetical protein
VAAGLALVEVAPHLAVDLAHVQPQHVRLEELGQRAADPLVVGAYDLQAPGCTSPRGSSAPTGAAALPGRC